MFFQKIKAVFEWISARRMKQSRRVLDYPWTTHQSIRHNPPPADSSSARSVAAEPVRPAAAPAGAAPAPVTAKAAVLTDDARGAAEETTSAPRKRGRPSKRSEDVEGKVASVAKATKTVRTKKKKAEVSRNSAAAEEKAAELGAAASESVPVSQTVQAASEPQTVSEKKPRRKQTKRMRAYMSIEEFHEGGRAGEKFNRLITPSRKVKLSYPRPPSGSLPWGQPDPQPSTPRVRAAVLRGSAKKRVTVDSPGADFISGRSLKQLRELLIERYPEVEEIGRAVKFIEWLDGHRDAREFLVDKVNSLVRRRGRPSRKPTADESAAVAAAPQADQASVDSAEGAKQ